eukprot:5106739-Pyramimonas_sp.AAC.1
MIIVAGLDYELTYSALANHGAHWDYLSLGRAMNDEEEALQFRAEVEVALAQQLQDDGYLEVDAWMRAHTLETAWEKVVTTIRTAAQA